MTKSIFTRFTEDKGSWWFRKFSTLTMFCFKSYSSFRVKILSSLKGIEIGSGCQFFGVPHFSRERFSTIQIGENCTFRSDHTSNLIGVNHKCILSTLKEGAIIKIGNNSGFSGATIGAAKKIVIGNNVLCGANSIITDTDWHSERSSNLPRPVIIEDNVWIGVNTVILKGVTIGKNSVIGASSLVVKDIPANVIAGGNPCKVLKQIT